MVKIPEYKLLLKKRQALIFLFSLFNTRTSEKSWRPAAPFPLIVCNVEMMHESFLTFLQEAAALESKQDKKFFTKPSLSIAGGESFSPLTNYSRPLSVSSALTVKSIELITLELSSFCESSACFFRCLELARKPTTLMTSDLFCEDSVFPLAHVDALHSGM